MKVMRDSGAMTSSVDNVDVCLSMQQTTAARRLICANAEGSTLEEQVADALELMKALGVHPRQVGELDYLLPPGPAMNVDSR